MQKFEIRTKSKKVIYNFPTTLKEIGNDYLTDVTSNIEVADYHVLVGLVYHNTLPNVIMSARAKKKNETMGVNVIFVKSGKNDTQILQNANVGNRILIDNSQLSLGHHVAAPKNQLSLSRFFNVLEDSVDNDLYQNAVKEASDKEIMFVEFKIVPATAIVAIYKDTSTESKYDFVEIEEVGGGM